jgi:ubiquinone/menaquinone biosynthesis C-methylase UbiE
MTYTHGHHESVLRSHKWRTVDNSAAYLAPRLISGSSVLDLGCGPGTITVDIGRRVAPGRVLGIDASVDVIEEARRDAGGGPNVEFSVGDLYALDTADDTFDVVHAHQVLQHLADPVGALREMKGVCKPGGLVAPRDGDYGAFRWYPDEPAMDRCLRCTAKSHAAMRASPTRADSSWRGRTPRAWTTCYALHCGASRRQTTARGGAGCGPTV